MVADKLRMQARRVCIRKSRERLVAYISLPSAEKRIVSSVPLSQNRPVLGEKTALPLVCVMRVVRGSIDQGGGVVGKGHEP